ncbi:MAG: glycerol-3-phosphate 1-O-acyltransferase PlsY [Erysipelotrichaceae bacterium]|nr:glycerol-3-phosphate 1-O-acyltransferase PlsY [Erysipelotrichaceae bacterium]
MKQALWILAAYLIGSIPWGLIIGKIFYHTDIREYGSGNLGGTNAGRVLGFPVGILVIFLDGSKSLLMMYLCSRLCPGLEKYVGLAVCFGHCFPIFAGFRGGKAVSCSYGYLLGLALFVTHRYFPTFILPWLVFMIVLLLSRMVSLSSMCGVLSAAISIFFFVDRQIGLMVLALALFVIYRHSANIKRILSGTEAKLGR